MQGNPLQADLSFGKSNKSIQGEQINHVITREQSHYYNILDY